MDKFLDKTKYERFTSDRFDLIGSILALAVLDFVL
jgi:hypothetical protein